MNTDLTSASTPHQPDSAAPAGSAPAATNALRRRAEDAAIMLLAGSRTERGITTDLGTFRPTPEALANAAFLIDLGIDEALVVPAADAHLLPRGEGGAELQGRAASMAQALRRERDWVRRRLQMPDHLLSYAERLQRAAMEADVYEALREVTTPVVGAYTCVMFVSAGEGVEAAFHPLADGWLQAGLEPLPAETAMNFPEQRLVTQAEIASDSAGPLLALDGLARATGATQLLCTPVGSDALLVLVERRRDRVLTGEDRDLLDALVRQAEAALRRVLSERQVAALDLKDPVTGLPSGRHVEIMLDHALGMARRGHPLTVLLVDLAKTESGTGPSEAEDAFYSLASSFSELRRTDLALRRDDNRFMVLLADTDAAGANHVIQRIREYVGDSGTLRTGIATYGPEANTAESLASAAVADLEGQGPDQQQE